MNLLHLEYFYNVAREGGYLRAAEKMRIRQPAISKMVGNLEVYLGIKLFEKVGRGVRLTPAGEDVFESCKKIFGEVEQLQLSMGKISGECKGPLLVGASEPIAGHFLPIKIAKLLKKHPKIHPNIFSGPSSFMLKAIEAGDLEMGFFFHLPELSEKVVIEKTLDINFRLVVHKDFKKNELVLAHFIGSRETDDVSTKKFPILEKLKKKYPKATIRTSSNNLSAHKELVLNGVGVSVLPEFLIKHELKEKLLMDVISDEVFVFQMKVVKRKNSVLSLNATSLLALI